MVCELKSVSRDIKILNFYFDFLIKIETDFSLNLEITSKTSMNAYKNLYLNMSTNLCGNFFESPLMMVLQPFLDKFAPGSFHKCPYLPLKEFGMRNFTIDPKMISSLPFIVYDRTHYRIRVVYVVKRKETLTLTLYTKFIPRRFSKKKPNSETGSFVKSKIFYF